MCLLIYSFILKPPLPHPRQKWSFYLKSCVAIWKNLYGIKCLFKKRSYHSLKYAMTSEQSRIGETYGKHSHNFVKIGHFIVCLYDFSNIDWVSQLCFLPHQNLTWNVWYIAKNIKSIHSISGGLTGGYLASYFDCMNWIS